MCGPDGKEDAMSITSITNRQRAGNMKYSPENIDFGNDDYNPKQYSFSASKADGMYMGRMLMRDEVIRLISATNPTPTKAVAKIIELVKQIPIEPPYADSVR
jgi:hypothetical protein